MTAFTDDTTQDIRATLDNILGYCLPDAAWLQSCLPIKLGGLGVQNPSLTCNAAYVASGLAECSGVFSPTGELATPNADFWEAVQALATQVGDEPKLSKWCADGFLPPSGEIIDAHLYSQKVWADKIHLRLREDLLNCVTKFVS
jgi:hypothetical protein